MSKQIAKELVSLVRKMTEKNINYSLDDYEKNVVVDFRDGFANISVKLNHKESGFTTKSGKAHGFSRGMKAG